MKCILVTDGTWGDTLPFIFLAQELMQRGHTVTLLSNEFYKSYAADKGITFRSTTTIEDRVHFLSDQDLWNPHTGMKVIGAYAGIMFTRTMPLLEDELAQGIDIIIAHSFSYAAKTYAEIHSLPYSSLLISPIQLRSSYRLPVFYGGKDYNNIPRCIKKFMYPLIDRFVLNPLFDVSINHYRRTHHLKPITNFVHYCSYSDVTICLWSSWYAPLFPDQTSYATLVGFPRNVVIETTPDTSLIEWAHAGKKPILVTLGSGYLFTDQLRTTLQEYARIHTERIILIGPNTQVDHVPDIQSPLVTRTHVSFSHILPHCELAIHHGGAGTLAQVIVAGIPHIIIPQSHDQPDNAAHILSNGLGTIIWNQRPSSHDIHAAVSTIRNSPDIYSACIRAQHTIHSDPRSGIQKAADAIEVYLAHAHHDGAPDDPAV